MNKELVQQLTNQFLTLNEDEKKEFLQSLHEWSHGNSFAELGLLEFAKGYGNEDAVYDNYPLEKLSKK